MLTLGQVLDTALVSANHPTEKKTWVRTKKTNDSPRVPSGPTENEGAEGQRGRCTGGGIVPSPHTEHSLY